MNPLLLPTLAGALAFFFAGIWLTRQAQSKSQKSLILAACLFAAVPAFLFAVFYTGIFGEAEWFYSFRALTGSELFATGAGLLAGWLQTKRRQSQTIRKQVSAGFIPFALALCVTAPYLKQIFLRPDWNSFSDRWTNGVCLQSSESSCGPASAATLLKHFGKTATEKEIAQASFTSRRGTENWYLLRTLRQRGLRAYYSISETNRTNPPSPAIVGVRLGSTAGAGHFIAVLGKSENRYVIGDPLNGHEELSLAELQDRYYFTGFAIVADSHSP
ncbi:MAG: hypothetical protein RLZZ350_2431 [Verrucomicrobiota bacterium]|jgi:hypothetical protein